MKQVYTSRDNAALELLKNMLNEAGIPAIFRNEQLSQMFPVAPFDLELWVENDEDFERAHALCETWFEGRQGANGLWTCSKCGQRMELQFDSCWKCGTQRESVAEHQEVTR